MATVEEQPEGRQALLEAAAVVVADKGLRGLTYRAVAAEAGVTYGLVFHHFGSRDAMIAETLDFISHRSMQESWLHRSATRVNDIGEGTVERGERWVDEQAFGFEMGLEARRRPDLQPRMRAIYEEYKELMQAQLVDIGFEPDEALAQLVFAAIDGLILQQVFFGAPLGGEAPLRRLHQLLQAELDAQASRSDS